MKKKTIITFSIILISVCISIFLFYRNKTKSPTYYWRNVTVTRGDLSLLVTATGVMAADTSVDVGVQVSGIIAKIKVDFNDRVKKGQVIAILDTTLLSATKLDAYATVQRSQVADDQAKREYDRTKKLFDTNVLPQSDYDLALTALQTAESNLVSAKAQLYRANINLKYCTITAPISGIVIARNVQVGNMVIASFNSPVLFTIANNLSKMQVQANVDEADIGQVKEGQLAKFTVDTYPNTIFSGEVTQVRHQPVIVQNVVNYVVIIKVPNPDLKLVPGLTANSNIFIDDRKNVLKVATNAFSFIPPLEYIQASTLLTDSVKTFWTNKIRIASETKKQEIIEVKSGIGYLWIIKGKEIKPLQVTRGLNDGSFTEVSGSIKEGEEVATGINQSAPIEDSKKTQNPFMPKFPTRKK